MVRIKINSILLYELKEQWCKIEICEFQFLNFITIFLQVFEVRHAKSVINRLEAQLLDKIILL